MERARTAQLATSTSRESEPCPTPLSWRDVVDRFREERTDFDFNTGGQTVQGAVFGTGQPLYFVNPAIGDFDQFALLGWRLREQFRCVFLNHPRPHCRRRMRLPEAAECLLATADYWGDDTFPLIAPGWGSVVALEIMLNVPSRVTAGVLVCGFAHRGLSWMERGLLAWGSRCPGPLSRIPGWQALQERNHRPWFPPFDETRWQFLRDNLAATGIRDAARRLAVIPETDLRPRLPEIEAPVLIVRSEGEGPPLTICQQELQEKLPAARTEWLHTTGQYSCLTHPHRLAKLVSSFLSPDPPGSPAQEADQSLHNRSRFDATT